MEVIRFITNWSELARCKCSHFYVVASSVATLCSLVGRYQSFRKTVTFVNKSAFNTVSRQFLSQAADRCSRHADLQLAAARCVALH